MITIDRAKSVAKKSWCEYCGDRIEFGSILKKHIDLEHRHADGVPRHGVRYCTFCGNKLYRLIPGSDDSYETDYHETMTCKVLRDVSSSMAGYL